MKQIEPMQQEYDKYTEDDFKVWKLLYEGQIGNLPWAASKAFTKGVELFGFNANEIPRFDDMNKVLADTTGWQLVVVPGLIDDDIFFNLMSSKKFPASTWFRKLEELEYLEEPDMFHDTFGHVPLLTNKPFTDFLAEISRLGLKYIDNPWGVELVSRIYWFTVEFGLIREEEGMRIYGAGILSSQGETKYCLSDEATRIDYDPEVILKTDYRKDVFQEQYFVIDNYEQLYESLPIIEEVLDREVKRVPAKK